jgi:tRNA pseudouridine-54 N-methylase
MDLYTSPTKPEIYGEKKSSILREAMEAHKIEVKLTGDMCLDDSDKNLIMIWSKAVNAQNEELIVCWRVSDPDAEEMKNMVSEWEEFVVLSAAGKPLGTAKDYFLTK